MNRREVGWARVVQVAVVSVALLGAGGCFTDAEPTGTDPGRASGERVARVQTGPNVRYVSPDGRDDAPGTERAPWGTLSHALPLLHAGQLLYVRGGRYREDLRRLALHEGTVRDRIVVSAYPGERPVVRGLVWLKRPSYWTVDGLDVTWDEALPDAPPHMVKITGGVGWSWRNSQIWGAVGAANLLVTGWEDDEPASWSLLGNCVHGLRSTDGGNRGSNVTIGDMGDDAGPGTVERNVIFDNPTGRNLTLGYRNGRDVRGPSGVLVRFNTLYDSLTSVRLAGDTTDVRIERNILGNVESGILVRTRKLGGAEVDVSGVKVQQNLGIASVRYFHRKGLDGELSPHRAGNTLVDYVEFDDVASCSGFHSTEGVTLPYGRDAIE